MSDQDPLSRVVRQLGGQQAFPVPASHPDPADPDNCFSSTPGLTKREWLAGLALQGLLVQSDEPDESIVERAVRCADFLLKELAP